MHDPEIYPDPMEFIPERYIASPGHEPQQDPASSVFGYGRRICPGIHIAQTALFLCASMSLAVFNTTPPVENGKPVPPVARLASGVISHPMPYKCNIKPRSAKAKSLILAANGAQ